MTDAVASSEACPICAGEAPRVMYRLQDFRILACRSCQQIYLRPLPTPEHIREKSHGGLVYYEHLAFIDSIRNNTPPAVNAEAAATRPVFFRKSRRDVSD